MVEFRKEMENEVLMLLEIAVDEIKFKAASQRLYERRVIDGMKQLIYGVMEDPEVVTDFIERGEDMNGYYDTLLREAVRRFMRLQGKGDARIDVVTVVADEEGYGIPGYSPVNFEVHVNSPGNQIINHQSNS